MTVRNTLLLFSKLPEEGLVKTRLTTLKDGMFEPAQAAHLYECMLLDVVDVILSAFAKEAERHPDESFDLIVSTAPAANVGAMEELLSQAGLGPVTVIADEGATFDEHYDHAFEQAWQRGADRVLSMGADMPALTEADVAGGFDALRRLEEHPHGGIVLAPDQEMGVSIVGWLRRTPFGHGGVFYNATGLTVLPAYVRKAREAGLPALYLPPVPDVDTMADLMHNVTLVEALGYCAPFDEAVAPVRTAAALQEMGIAEVRVMPNGLLDPRAHIDGE